MSFFFQVNECNCFDVENSKLGTQFPETVHLIKVFISLNVYNKDDEKDYIGL